MSGRKDGKCNKQERVSQVSGDRPLSQPKLSGVLPLAGFNSHGSRAAWRGL